MDKNDDLVRRAFALAVNSLYRRLWPRAERVEMLGEGNHHELLLEVDGYTFKGTYIPIGRDSYPQVEVAVVGVLTPEGERLHCYDIYTDPKSELGPSYRKRFHVDGNERYKIRYGQGVPRFDTLENVLGEIERLREFIEGTAVENMDGELVVFFFTTIPNMERVEVRSLDFESPQAAALFLQQTGMLVT